MIGNWKRKRSEIKPWHIQWICTESLREKEYEGDWIQWTQQSTLPVVLIRLCKWVDRTGCKGEPSFRIVAAVKGKEEKDENEPGDEEKNWRQRKTIYWYWWRKKTDL